MRFIQCHDFNYVRCKTTKLYFSKLIQKHKIKKNPSTHSQAEINSYVLFGTIFIVVVVPFLC